MDKDTRKFIRKTVKSELDRQRREGQPTFFSKEWFQTHLFSIVISFLSIAAILIAYKSYTISYEATHPTAYYEIEYDIDKNFDEFSRFIERYMNDRSWSYDDLGFNIYMKIKNKNPKIEPRLDSIGGEFQIDIWQMKNFGQLGKSEFELISTLDEYLMDVPLVFIDNHVKKRRPTVRDLLVGHIRYQREEGDWLALLSRFRTQAIFDEMDKYGDLTLTTRYPGKRSPDYEPESEGAFASLNLSLDEFESKDISDLLRRFVHIKFVGRFKAKDHLENVYKRPLVLVYDGLLGDPRLTMQYEKASRAYETNNFSEAATMLSSIVKRNPYYEEAYYLLGMTYLGLSNENSANDAFLKASGLGHIDANLEVAKYYLNSSDIANATRYAAAYVRRRGEIRKDLSIDSINRLRSDVLNPILVAMKSSQLSIEAKNNLAIGYYAAGVAYKNAKKNNDAIQALKESTMLNPNNITAHYDLAELYYESNEFRNTANTISKCIELANSKKSSADDSWSATHTYACYVILGMSYKKMKDYKKSIQTFRALINMDPDRFGGYSGRKGLAFVYEDLGDYDSAIRFLDEALKIAERNKYGEKYGADEIRGINEKLETLKRKTNP